MLENLNLDHNDFDDSAVTYLTRMLAKNRTLRLLSLCCSITGRVAKECWMALSEIISEHPTIQSLNLSCNTINIEVFAPFAKWLTSNSNLRELALPNVLSESESFIFVTQFPERKRRNNLAELHKTFGDKLSITDTYRSNHTLQNLKL